MVIATGYSPNRIPIRLPVLLPSLPPLPPLTLAVLPTIGSHPFANFPKGWMPPFNPMVFPQPGINLYKQQALTPSNVLPQYPVNTPAVWSMPLTFQPIQGLVKPKALPDNPLKKLFQDNQAVIYALFLRTFASQDRNRDGRISVNQGENGTFLSAIPKLDELAALGVNTIHLLPVNPLGKIKHLGEAGSAYCPSDLHHLNPEFKTPGSPLSLEDEARLFIQEAHKRGIYVMADIPSCASYDLARNHPELIARDSHGNGKTPQNWVDILMMENNKALLDYYEGYFDLMANRLGVDGFRADVARARPPWFWAHFINKYPNLAWLAETYVSEAASPMANVPADNPERLLKTGFDSIYAQFHTFHNMPNATAFMNYMVQLQGELSRAGIDKSTIGSFLTHDDPSLMENGGVPMYYLTSGMMASLPWMNPYIWDGFLTGYDKPADIYNFVPRPTGNHPEIGSYLKYMLQLRQSDAYQKVLTQGLFIPIPVYQSDEDQIIAFARQYRGKTLLVVANKDINASHHGTLYIPGLRANQSLRDLSPSYGAPSEFLVEGNHLNVKTLGPGRFHLFEIDTPNLSIDLPSYR